MSLQTKIDEAYPRYYDYDVVISNEKWKELIQDQGIFTEQNIEHLKCVYTFENHAATCKEVSKVLGGHPTTYIGLATGLAKRIATKLNLNSLPAKDKSDTEVFWYILFYGRNLPNEDRGAFEWKLKPELAEALKELYPSLTYPAPIIEKKLDDVPTAVWLATAILTFNSFRNIHNLADVKVYYKIAEIQKLAQKICTKNVQYARLYQWYNGDHRDHTYAYLREGDGTLRRLTAPGEFSGLKERPENLDEALELEFEKDTVTVGTLVMFIDGPYSDLIEKNEQVEAELDTYTDTSAIEGRKIRRTHIVRERDPRIIRLAIQKAIEVYGKAVCEACGFDFEEQYGQRGKNFIEGHHKVPLSHFDGPVETRVEDIALVCANCHRMIHRKEPWLSMKQLKGLLNN